VEDDLWTVLSYRLSARRTIYLFPTVCIGVASKRKRILPGGHSGLLSCALSLHLWLAFIQGLHFPVRDSGGQGADMIECIDAGLFGSVFDRHDFQPYTSLSTLIVNEICELTACTRVRDRLLYRLT